jgi:8-oxo-dGTP pyrophosphatase MutT (NUDIX family)
MAMGKYVTKMKKHLPEGESFVMASAQVIIMNDEDKVLITKRADNGRWDFPGGGCEEEDSFKQTAVKEMKEELNLDILEEDLEFLGVISASPLNIMEYPNNSKTKYYTTVFGVTQYTGDIKFADGENTEYAFVNLEDALNYDLILSSRYVAQQLLANNIPFIN